MTVPVGDGIAEGRDRYRQRWVAGKSIAVGKGKVGADHRLEEVDEVVAREHLLVGDPDLAQAVEELGTREFVDAPAPVLLPLVRRRLCRDEEGDRQRPADEPDPLHELEREEAAGAVAEDGVGPAEKGAQLGFVAQGTLLVISGVYYPVNVLPAWMQWLSTISPATYALRGIRRALLDGGGLGAVWGDIWPLMIIGVLAMPLGLWVFHTGERYAKKHA